MNIVCELNASCFHTQAQVTHVITCVFWRDKDHLLGYRSIKVNIRLYRVSQEERTKRREGVPYVKLYRYNPKHLYPKLNGYGDNGKRSLKL